MRANLSLNPAASLTPCANLIGGVLVWRERDFVFAWAGFIGLVDVEGKACLAPTRASLARFSG